MCLVLGVQSWERIEANLYMALRFLGSPSDPELQVIFDENNYTYTLDLLAPDPFKIMLSKGGSLWKL